MKLFVDTANLEEIKKAKAMGVIDGVTTNPSLVAREKVNFQDLLREICQIVKGPVSAEVTEIKIAQDMVKEARSLAKIDKHIVIFVIILNPSITSIIFIQN